MAQKNVRLNLSIAEVELKNVSTTTCETLNERIDCELHQLIAYHGLPTNLIRSRQYQSSIALSFNHLHIINNDKELATCIAYEIYQQLQSAR